jgi:DNA-binding HxlR family transcriptional regulator
MTLVEAHKDKISGVLSCYDRVIINGVAGGDGFSWGYAGGMTCFFNKNHLRMFDFATVFKPVTEKIIANAQEIAEKNGVEIEYIRSPRVFRKEERIAGILAGRGMREGLVHIFSCLEVSETYKPWHDRDSGEYYFNKGETKCLCYYFYFIDRELGLCFLKVPTTAPYRLTYYFNGHNWLEHKLIKKEIRYEKEDNAYIDIEDYGKAQELSDKMRVEDLHRVLDIMAWRYSPLPAGYGLKYNWTLHQVEYAQDIVFKDEKSLEVLYENIIKTAMHTVTPEDIANFLGKRFSVLFEGEAGSRYNKRILGTRIKHQMGEVSVKVYDKFGKVLRIEITANNVGAFKAMREVYKRDGSVERKVAPLPKSIYSLFPLVTVFKNAINRYLGFISAFDDTCNGVKRLDKLTGDVKEKERTYKGFNVFKGDDEQILLAVAEGKFNLKGISNKALREQMPEKSSGQVSRILKRLRLHGLIKKIGKTYLYYLTEFGKQVIVTCLKLKNMFLVPELSRG